MVETSSSATGNKLEKSKKKCLELFKVVECRNIILWKLFLKNDNVTH
jgi:hypothetical protein